MGSRFDKELNVAGCLLESRFLEGTPLSFSGLAGKSRKFLQGI